MTTAIAVYGSEGVVGRCDARCHEAKKPDCGCICGGRLHGVGAARAVEQNTRDLLGDEATEALRDYAERIDVDPDALRLEFPDVQQALL